MNSVRSSTAGIWVTRQISARRYSVGPINVSAESSVPLSKRCTQLFHWLVSAIERTLRASTAICGLSLIVVWIVYFFGSIEKDRLLLSNGVLILIIIVSALLRRRSMRAELGRMRVVSSQVQRPFPSGALVHSGSDPGETLEDTAVVNRIQQLFIEKLMLQSTKLRPFAPSLDCTSCVICLVDFEPGVNVSELICQHSFHCQCLLDWFRVQLSVGSSDVMPSCPTCRKELVLSEESLNAFTREVCEPSFLAPYLSHRVHVVFNPHQS